MRAIDRKLLRDLWRMKGQAFAIVLVIVSGVATYIMLKSTMDSLRTTRETFYREYGFAQVFASLKRAPESLKYRIAEIPGVDRVETRVAGDIKIEVKDFGEPVTARLVSLPESGEPHLNRVHIRNGRTASPRRDDEAIVSEAFAEAHGLKPGDRIRAIINGRRKDISISGIALSPEFVLQVRPGALSPDYKRYAILWMGRDALSRAYDMEGAFNDVVLSLSKGVQPKDVITMLDELLDRYGGLGAYERKDQTSNRYLSEEFKQLERSARIFPAIFIAVAAFLLNVVISRTVSTQRDQIAALKAFGYDNISIGAHYIKLVMLITLAGVAGGFGVGMWLGKKLGGVYMMFYKFPYLIYQLRPSVAVAAAAVTIGASIIGTLFSVRRAAKMPPAEALRPEPPVRYRQTLLDRLGYGQMLSQPTKMIVRNIERRPVKSLLSVIGIALSCAIVISGTFSTDSVDYIIDVQFKRAQQEDMTITFTEPTSKKAIYDLQGVQGVNRAEPFRSVPVKVRFRHKSYRTFIQGIPPDNRLQRLLDTGLNPIHIPPEGIVLADYLANLLDVRPGDVITVEALEGSRPVIEIPVAGLARQYIGIGTYMDIDALNRVMKEGGAISGAYLSVDRHYLPGIYRKMVEMPRVVGTSVRMEEIRSFYKTQAEVLLFFTFIATLLAATIAFGVVYNSARISLSERSRELASLRVLGYTRSEISYIFFGELGMLILAAIPLGFVLGSFISAYIANALSSDLYRVPIVIRVETFSFAAAVVVGSAFVSGLIVRYRLDRLDLVEVLKARE